MMTWDCGLDEAHYPLLDQKTTQTVDGQPSENAENDCAMTCLAAVGQYLGDIIKLPDEVKDEGWKQSYIGPSGPPETIQTYASTWMLDPHAGIWHPSTPQAAAAILYNLLYWKRPAIYLVTNVGVGHWVTALHMWGTLGGPPFDLLSTHNPYGGTRWALDFPTFANKLRRYDDGNYLVVGFGRARAVQTETRFGP